LGGKNEWVVTVFGMKELALNIEGGKYCRDLGALGYSAWGNIGLYQDELFGLAHPSVHLEVPV